MIIGNDIVSGEAISLPPNILHTYIIGNTGVGKTTLERAMILGNITAGHGVCVIDPHGERTDCLVNGVMNDLPTKRIKDVILFDVNNSAIIPGLKPFYCRNKHDPIAVQDTISTALNIFEKVYNVDRNTMARIIAYIESLIYLFIYDDSLTLLDVPTLLNPDPKFDKKRNAACMHLPPSPGFNFTRDFWVEEYPRRAKRGYNQDSEIFGTLMKFRELSSHLLWPIFCQKTNTLDIRSIMQQKKILLVKLNGNWGDITSLLGSYLIGQIKDAAMNRSLKDPPFYLYVDEFSSMASRDFLKLFSEGRGGNIHITVDHQVISQLDEDMLETIRQVDFFACFETTDITAASVAAMFDSTPPPGEWIYEKQMRMKKYTDPAWYWDPPEKETLYTQLEDLRLSWIKKLESGTSPIAYELFHEMLLERMYKQRYLQYRTPDTYEDYLKQKKWPYPYSGYCEYLYPEDEVFMSLYSYEGWWKGLTDRQRQKHFDEWAWEYFKLLCYRSPLPIPGVDPVTQQTLKRHMHWYMTAAKHAKELKEAHYKYGSREIDAGWYEPVPIMEWEYLQIARDLGQNPAMGENVKYTARKGPSPYGSDEVQRRNANQLKQFDKFIARVRLPSGEYVIKTPPPKKISERKLNRKIVDILTRNINDGYLRTRADIEQEFTTTASLPPPNTHIPVPSVPLPVTHKKP